MQHSIYEGERNPLLKKTINMFTPPADRGEAIMGALRKHADEHRFELRKPTREVPPAEYSDEVTDEQLEAARKKMAKEFEDWIVVDGPAW